MTASRQSIVIGIFEDRTAVAQALHALLKAGFQENQLGFVARQEHAGMLLQQEELKERTSSPHTILRGIVGGMMGAIDLLLAPITGPSDASSMLATALPATEEVIDRMTHSGMHFKQLPPVPNGQATPSERSQQLESDQAQERTSVVAGGVVGTAVAALLLPEIGLVVAGGLLATLLSGAALGGMAGGFLGTFANMGVQKKKITYYKQEMKARKTLVTVQTADCQGEAMEILSHYAAHDVATYSRHG